MGLGGLCNRMRRVGLKSEFSRLGGLDMPSIILCPTPCFHLAPTAASYIPSDRDRSNGHERAGGSIGRAATARTDQSPIALSVANRSEWSPTIGHRRGSIAVEKA